MNLMLSKKIDIVLHDKEESKVNQYKDVIYVMAMNFGRIEEQLKNFNDDFDKLGIYLHDELHLSKKEKPFKKTLAKQFYNLAKKEVMLSCKETEKEIKIVFSLYSPEHET